MTHPVSTGEERIWIHPCKKGLLTIPRIKHWGIESHTYDTYVDVSEGVEPIKETPLAQPHQRLEEHMKETQMQSPVVEIAQLGIHILSMWSSTQQN